MNIKTVCVIGAGVSGLVAAKTFLEEGFDVTVLEKKAGLGGVWEKSSSYPEVKTQSSRDTYCFSDYPMPEDYPQWPNGEQVRAYLQSYADNFGVSERIRFQANVTDISRKTGEEALWVVSFKINHEDEVKEQKQEFDFVLVCNGVFNIPKFPTIPGNEEFIAAGGKILHSIEFKDTSLIKDKRVVVVGFGKSACDIATFAVDKAKESTLVFRRALWKIPHFFLNKIQFENILFTRFAELWLPVRKPEGIEKLLHSVGKPLVWAFWRFNELVLRKQFNLEGSSLLPAELMNKTLSCSANLAPEHFYEYIHSGKIKAKKASIAKFVSDGVALDSGEKLQADVVIFGTGFYQDIPFIEQKYRQLVMDEKGNFKMFRNLIHPDIPNMGFLGYNSSFFCPLTSEIGAWWLAEYVKGNLVLPTPSQMREEMDKRLGWSINNLPPAFAYGSCVAPLSFHYLEDLIEDMGFKIFGKGAKPLQGMMERIKPSAYQKIRQQLRSKKPSVKNTLAKEAVNLS
ncbi:putative flavoprotein involved in K+ transport [Rivularia sp. PCC 7116]|uniref:flavin-containing monooxygenase n=1 Tax=Rivularia sp. PCC 7116 TaxID=373994 RepID=UPI00029EE866|nr:NAD(P)-binding domain-containing protein [Rivularia sp. PCC 7116]AFY57831.1 putative flavoprotein involved in K+ transport [Rivularia sp. PCC 7116]